MKMTKLPALLYLLFGALNAALSGLMAWMGTDLMWTGGIVAAMSVFAIGAILLMRAPFSKRNIDSPLVDLVRVVLVLAYAGLLYTIWPGTPDDLDWATVAVFAVMAGSVALVILMPTFRHGLGARRAGARPGIAF